MKDYGKIALEKCKEKYGDSVFEDKDKLLNEIKKYDTDNKGN